MQTLSAEGIGKSYGGRQVVREVSLTISRGEVVGLLGPNGAGKTTSFYMIVGLVVPESGRVMVDDAEITKVPMYLRARNHGISYLPQEPSVFRKLTVEDNIMGVLEAQPISAAESPPYSNDKRLRALGRRAPSRGDCALSLHSTEFSSAG